MERNLVHEKCIEEINVLIFEESVLSYGFLLIGLVVMLVVIDLQATL